MRVSTTPSVTWQRVLHRTAGALGAAVLLSAVTGTSIAVSLRSSDHPNSVESCVTPTATPTESPTETPVATPTESPLATESAAPETEAPECAAPTAAPTASPSATESEAPEATDDGGEHGAIVSTVAHGAPHGKDPLLSVEGAPANHGAYVTAAAHGDS